VNVLVLESQQWEEAIAIDGEKSFEGDVEKIRGKGAFLHHNLRTYSVSSQMQ
jgi:hypothetical protein